GLSYDTSLSARLF
nr:immunoglobulin light chain junction region [Macaca mulatta]